MRKNLLIVSTLALLAGCQNGEGSAGLDVDLPPTAKEDFAANPSSSTNAVSSAQKRQKNSETAELQDEDKLPDLKVSVSEDEIKKSKSSKDFDKTLTASTKSKKGGGIVIPAYRAPKVGTVFTFKNNWQSLEPKLVYKVVSAKSEFRGKSAIQFKAIEGTGSGASTYFEPTSHNLLGYKDKNGNSTVTYTQVEQRLKFPMRPGDQWVSSWAMYNHSTKKVTKGGGVVKVVGPEKLAISAGRFKAMKIQLPLPPDAGRGMKHFIWYSPSLGVVIREQISNNQFSWSKELEKVKKPG